MQHLIDSFSPTTDSLDLSKGFQTVNVFKQQANFPFFQYWSIIFRSPTSSVNSLNQPILNLLEAISKLTDNWDEEGALKPDPGCIEYAKAIILYMEAIRQEIYSIAPGPHGEVMLDFRENKKSFEIILYKDKAKYVKFGYNEKPEQGVFSPEILFSELIEWLNKK